MRFKMHLLTGSFIRTLNLYNLKYYSRTTMLNNKADQDLENWKELLHNTMQIIPNFISTSEEESLIEEVDPYMKRLRYEEAHWDDAIHAYRETERKNWNKKNEEILNRVRATAFPKEMLQLPLIHVLDLASEGWIKPHVDSIRFCGEIIAGLSLLSDCVMRLTMVGHETTHKDEFLLPQRSLYIMSGVARYNYNHEILKNEESYFEGQHVPRSRRISIICRCHPNNNE
ncbi:alpha-ketoglutarate-dependent dioxygenase alkB homolog 7, mitochondrial [Megalopta genalis]|uniref:alpha-ketoglutarate-dependent dioxygenase alkB homolog 7, mitochondrial n=1 Tax=Megalopta genalis TaxID=115081 RepID=UPI003FD1EE09